jgi:hypothetical protein
MVEFEAFRLHASVSERADAVVISGCDIQFEGDDSTFGRVVVIVSAS